jgi:ankyrin repeat protein
MASLAAAEDISRKSPLLALPNELLWEVAPHLTRFRDLNSLLRTSRFFHTLFHTLLYRRAITADDTIRDGIVAWVLSKYRVASLAHLLDNGLSANHKFRNGRDLLRALCSLSDKERSVSLARLLLERGAEFESKDDPTSRTVLHDAVLYNNREIAALLLAHGTDIHAVTPCGKTPLHHAANTDNCDIATLLLAHGADVNVADKDGYTPIHCAVSRGGCDFIKLLLAHGAAVDARCLDGDTPLFLALRGCNSVVIPVLLAHGADVDARDDLGRTPLHLASASFVSDDHQSAKLLLEYGADVNARDFGGRTPLHWVTETFIGSFCDDDELFLAEILVENGADVNVISEDGRSPLQEALSGSTSEDYTDRLVALLIAHGADFSVLNSHERAIWKGPDYYRR